MDPTDPIDVAKGIDRIMKHPLKARQMGVNGLQSIEHEYNWDTQFRKLINTYEQIYNTEA